MTINEIALALTAWMWVHEIQRMSDKNNMKAVAAIVHLIIYLFAIVYLFYFMGRSVLFFFGVLE